MSLRHADIAVLCLAAPVAAVLGSMQSPWTGLTAGTASAAAALILLANRSRRDRLARADIARQIARLADAGIGSGPLQPSPDAAEPPEELEDIARQVSELRRRLNLQVKELAKKTRNLESLIDGMDEPVLVTGDQDTVLLCNRAAEQLLGVRGNSLLGLNIKELFTSAEVISMHRRAKSGAVLRNTVKVTSPTSGVRSFQTSASPLPVAWGDGIFGVIIVLRDVTELAAAVQLQTDFVANASHELRTPVAALKAALETLDDGAKDEPVLLNRLLTICNSNLTRLEEMVRDLLDLSRLQTPDMPVRHAPVQTDELQAVLRISFEIVCQRRGLTLDLRIDPALSGMQSDVKLLSMVLRNLIENATKFAYEHTTVRVRGSLLPPSNSPSSSPAADLPKARFTVADRGIGIPLDQQARVFERFYQVDAARSGHKAQGRGSGLGLAIVKQAVTTLGGTVGLESVYGEGTTVWIELPLAEAPTGSEKLSSSPASAVASTGPVSAPAASAGTITADPTDAAGSRAADAGGRPRLDAGTASR